MAYGTILIVEDQAEVSALYQNLLSSAGYTVFAADSGERALEMLDTIRPQAVLMDIRLPGIDGIETTRRMRKAMRRQAPVIFLTNENDPDVLVRGLEAGGDDYLLKTIKPTEVSKRLARWLACEDVAELPKLRREMLSRVKLAIC